MDGFPLKVASYFYPHQITSLRPWADGSEDYFIECRDIVDRCTFGFCRTADLAPILFPEDAG